MRKIRPSVFLRAANRVKQDLKLYPNNGMWCCWLFKHELNVYGHELFATPEYQLFARLFKNKRGRHTSWFGSPNTPNNQKKRFKALMKAYKVAKKMREKQ